MTLRNARLGLIVALISLSSAVSTAAGAEPRLDARMTLEHASTAPQQSTTIAVVLKMSKDWHIYHPILLDTGLPTTLEFEAPPGVKIGRPEFPKPKYESDGDIRYLAYEDEVVVLAPLKVEDLKPGSELPLRVKVSALICETDGGCVPITAEAETTLKVSEKQGDPTDAKLFEAARAAMPKPLAQADYLGGSSVAVAPQRVAIGKGGEITLVLNIEKGLHIQDRNPGVEGFIPTRVFIEKIPGVEFDWERQKWPKPKVENVPDVGRVRMQQGRVVIATPFKAADPKMQTGPVTARVLVEYQACNDKGSCFLPMMAEGEIVFEVTPAAGTAEAATQPAEGDAATTQATGAVDTEPPSQSTTQSEATAAAGEQQYPLWYVLLLAFIGGAILNVMPCVLPVISLKIFGFMSQAGESQGRVAAMGLTYAAGILSSFAILAGALVAWQGSVTWGGVIMQSPTALVVLCCVVVVFGLAMIGVFEVRLPGFVSDAGSAASTKEGYGGAFVNGVLATVLATPCTGPFLGFAVGFAATLAKPLAFATIMMVGVGLATPYVLLTAIPGLVKVMPKPGAWMVAVKQVMGFVMLGVTLWLLWILHFHGGAALVLWTLTGLFGLGVGCWAIGRIGLNSSPAKRLALWAVALSCALAAYLGGTYFFRDAADQYLASQEAQTAVGDVAWRGWEPGIGPELAGQGYTVYVDYTAAWCLTCQTNKGAVLHSEAVAKKFADLGVVAIIADITRSNPAIEAEIRQFGRNGVPLNIIYPANRPNEPIVLPELLTQALVLRRLDEAGPSTAVAPVAADAGQ